MDNRISQLEQLLATKQAKIQSLIEVTKAVNNNFSKSALLRIFEYTLTYQLNIKNIALFVLEENWTLQLSSGNIETTKQIDVTEDLLKFQVLQKITNFPGELFKGFDYLIPIVHKKNAIGYLLIGDIEIINNASIDERLRFIETITSFILVSLENKRMFKKQLKQERIGKEIELAAQVQTMLIPNNLPKNDKLEAAGYYRPHGSIGGDYYDYIEIDNNHVAFCMCDVSGKGIGAGMIMANFQANLRALVNKDIPVGQLIERLNSKLKQTTKGDKFITMFFGIYNISSRKLKYINAGHNPPLLVSNGNVKLLKDGSTILGVFDNLPFIKPQELTLEENSQLLMYTDGLSELENEQGEMFDEDKLKKFAIEHENLSAELFINELITALDTYKGKQEYNDDVSILNCRFF